MTELIVFSIYTMHCRVEIVYTSKQIDKRILFLLRHFEYHLSPAILSFSLLKLPDFLGLKMRRFRSY